MGDNEGQDGTGGKYKDGKYETQGKYKSSLIGLTSVLILVAHSPAEKSRDHPQHHVDVKITLRDQTNRPRYTVPSSATSIDLPIRQPS